MKKWSFNIERNPQETSKKLEAALIDRFVFRMNQDRDNSTSFKLRKRILYIWYMYFHNWTIATGKILKAGSAERTNIEISFSQHWFIQLIIYSQMLIGLGFIATIFLGFSTPYILFGGILLALEIVLLIVVKKKFKKDVQEYKALMTEVLEL